MLKNIGKIYANYLLKTNPIKLFSTLSEEQWYVDIQLEWMAQQSIANNMLLAEIGCGPGTLCEHLAPVCSNIYGFDKDARMVAAAKSASRSSNARYLQWDVCDDVVVGELVGQCDRVFAASLLNLIKDKKRLIDVAIALAKPGGKVSFLFPTPAMTAENVRQYARSSAMRGLSLAFLETWQERAPKMSATKAVEYFSGDRIDKISTSFYMQNMIAAVTVEIT
mgnify:CR=1 FL=1